MTATLMTLIESQASIPAFSAQRNFIASQVKTFTSKGVEPFYPSPSKLLLREASWVEEYMEGFQNLSILLLSFESPIVQGQL